MIRLVAVTGATGFVGSSLCKELRNRNIPIRALYRDKYSSIQDGMITGPIGQFTDWSTVLEGVDTIIHCAAYAHQLRDTYSNQLHQCNTVNRDGTIKLAESAAAIGVRRLIFLSSIKVNGEQTLLNQPFNVSSVPNPTDPYGLSKWEAEQSLHHISDRTGLEVVIVRPPLVYGPGVKANFLRLVKLVHSGIPLPFAGICNRRSMISLANLLDLLILCVIRHEAAGKTFLVSDGLDFSTPALIRELASSMGLPARLFWLPMNVLSLTGRALGKAATMDRLIGSLQIDISTTCSTLDWTPPYTVSQSIDKVADWFLQR